MNLQSIVMASSTNENKNATGVQPRRRPTNNQLLYKAHFHWKFYSQHCDTDVDGVELSLRHNLPTATEACASVTTAFLEVLKVLYDAEVARGTSRNCLEHLASNTRRTKVLQNGLGGHRNGEEMRKNVIRDKDGNEFTTNLDRNRYGSDNNYLSTVIRYDLEFLGLDKSLIEVEIIDAKSGKTTDADQPLEFNTKGFERDEEVLEAMTKLETTGQGNGGAARVDIAANNADGGRLERPMERVDQKKNGLVANKHPGKPNGINILLSALTQHCGHVEEAEKQKRPVSAVAELSKGDHIGKRSKTAFNGVRSTELKQESHYETHESDLRTVCNKLRMECTKTEKEKQDLEAIVQRQSRELAESSNRESALQQRAERAEGLLTILGFEIEAAKAFFAMAISSANGPNAQQQQQQQANTREESLRAGTNTTHQQAAAINIQDRRNSNAQSGNAIFNQAAFPFRGATTTTTTTTTNPTPTPTLTPTPAPSQAEAMNATFRSYMMPPPISALMNAMSQGGGGGNPSIAGMIPMAQAIASHDNQLIGPAGRMQQFAAAQGDYNRSVLQPTPTHAVGPLQMEGITDNGPVRP